MATIKCHFYHAENRPFEPHDSMLVEVEGAGGQWCISEWERRMGHVQPVQVKGMMLELRRSAEQFIASVPVGTDIANVIPVIDRTMIEYNAPFATLVVNFR